MQSGCTCQAGNSACISSTLLQTLPCVPIFTESDSIRLAALLLLLYSLLKLETFHWMQVAESLAGKAVLRNIARMHALCA